MDRTSNRFESQVQEVRQQMQAKPLLFADCLSSEIVRQAITEARVVFRETIYTPWITLWAFLSQLLQPEGSCAFAVSQGIAYRVGQGQKTCSPSTSTYCESRDRLPEAFFESLVRTTGQRALEETPEARQFHGRDVKVADGTTVMMPDTEENRKDYPLSDPDRAGLSFPMARLLVVFSLAVGTVLQDAISPYRGKGTSEQRMLCLLLETFVPEDIMLGDRGFCSFAHVAALKQREVDSVVKLNKSRRANLTLIRPLGKDDALYCWNKPKGQPTSFDRKTFLALPEAIEVRCVTVRVEQRGFRVRKFVVLTTLLDSETFPPQELATLFRRRWMCELYLRDIKTTLGMEMLGCKSPSMVRKEIHAYFLAYNVIRIQMAQAAHCLDLHPHQISFKSTLDTLAAFRTQLQQLR